MEYFSETFDTKVTEHLDNLLELSNDSKANKLTKEMSDQLLLVYFGRFIQLPRHIQNEILELRDEYNRETHPSQQAANS